VISVRTFKNKRYCVVGEVTKLRKISFPIDYIIGNSHSPTSWLFSWW